MYMYSLAPWSQPCSFHPVLDDWTTRFAMTIAKRGARAALDKARELAATSAPVAGATADSGPLGEAEPPTLWEEGSYASLGRAFSRASLSAGGEPVAGSAGGG